MKKRILFFVVFALVVFVLPVSVHAINLGGDLVTGAATKAGYSSQTSETTLAEIIGQVIRVALSFVGIIFTALTVYAGFLWMTARGDESMVDKSKKTLTTAVVGLIITLGSYSITAFILPRILERTTGDGGAQPGIGGPPVSCCEVCIVNGQLNRADACHRVPIFSSNQTSDTQACQFECVTNPGGQTCTFLGEIPRGQCN